MKILTLLAAGLCPLLLSRAAAAPGDIYESDFGSGTVKRISPTGSVSTFVSGLASPSGIAFDSAGNLFVSEFGNNSIVKVARDGSKTVFATGLTQPFGLAFDPTGNLFEGDRSGHIFKFTPAGAKSTFAEGLNIPAGLAFNSAGRLFETDFGSGQVFTFQSAMTLFASGLTSPNGIAFSAKGDLYVSDSGVGTIYKFTPAGTKSTFAAGLGQPTGLVFDTAGNLFVSDNAAGAIFKFTPTGVKSTFAPGFTNPQHLAIERSTGVLLNLSTRAQVLNDDNVLIGGFIIQGTEMKKVLLRGIGPSLADSAITGFLPDPTMELHEPDGTLVTNDNWRDTQEQEIVDTTIPPKNDLESAIVATLAPGAYTVILAGKEGGEGVGLVEIYDLDQAAAAQLANISTRGVVGTGEDVMIAGFIIAGDGTVVVRALGPSLAGLGVHGVLQNPVLELHDSEGALVGVNDDWRDGPDQQAISDRELAPPNDKESALLASLAPGAYTAIESGQDAGTGVGLIEVFNLQ